MKRPAVPLILVLSVLLMGFPVAAEEDFSGLAVAVIGDSGCGCKAQRAVAERMWDWYREKPFSLVLMLGDNIYGEGGWRGSSKGGDKALFESRFDSFYAKLLEKGVKFYAVLGNHDLDTRRGRDEIADTERFNILSPRGYYSFSPEKAPRDLVTFFGIFSDSLTGGRKDAVQLAWLKESLQSGRSKWEIVFSHDPLYTPPGAHSADRSFRQSVEPILKEEGVRIFLSGHNHFYGRMKPQDGIHYFVSGGGGRDLKTPKESDLTARAARAYHFLYMEIREDRVDFQAVDDSGRIIDQGTIR